MTSTNPLADKALSTLLAGKVAIVTGGNSGSPVLNGRGELVGLNFDRVYENIAGDWGYTRERSRNIFVSTQAILWFLDVIVDAKDLLEELGQKATR